MSWTLGKKITGGFGVGIVSLILVAGLSYRSAGLLTTEYGVAHTFQVLGKSETILSVLKDAETGQRGFLLTGEERYLEPYTASLTAIQDAVGEVRDLTVDNPAQQDRIVELEKGITAKYEELQQTIDLRRTAGFDAAVAVVLTDEGKIVMDQIRGIVEEIKAAEETLLLERQQESADAIAQVNSNITIVVWVAFFAVLISSAVGWFVIRLGIQKPLKQTMDVLEAVAAGDLTRRLDTSSTDELGQMATGLNTTVSAMRSAIEEIAGTATTLGSSAEELSAVSTQMGSNANETSTQANVVSAAAEQVSSNVETVASGAEELSASIKEIAKNTSEAARVATSAVDLAESTTATVSKLGDSSVEIGNVIKVITSIAEQTNLLALNATIEAARAGEAGKGFAVVANEVKELAKETAKATDDIRQKVEAIQVDTSGAVDAIGQITKTITEINDIQNTIAS